MPLRRHHLIVLISLLILWGVWYLKYDRHHSMLRQDKVTADFWGVTFSKKYAQELGLDWRAAYLATVDELAVKNIRLPVYWDDVETMQGEFDFADYDWMINEGEKRDVHFILNIGRRLPRWPECHQPGWTQGIQEKDLDERHIFAVQTAIRHFKGFSAIRYWQLENEYFFPWFGECPEAKIDLIQREITILRSEDTRPLVLTDSGELNSWRKAAKNSDILGITIYRVVWNNYFGYFRWPWPAALYRAKAYLVGKDSRDMMVAELQAEPWPAHFKKVNQISADEAAQSFDLRQFETNSEIARRTGFRQAYFWGVEWWYWMREHGDASFWNKAQEIIQQR